MASSSEPYIMEYRAKLAPHFQAMAALPELAPKIVAQLSASSDAAGDAYKAVLAANQAARLQLAEHGSLTDGGPATTLRTELGNASARIAAADEHLSKLTPDLVPVLAPVYGEAPKQRRMEEAGPVIPTTPVAPAPAAPVASVGPVAPVAPSKPTETKDDLGKLLSALRSSQPAMGNPMGGMGSPMGGGAPGGTPLAGPSTTPKSEGRKLDDGLDRKRERHEEETPKLAAAKPDNKSAEKPVNPAAAPTAPAAAPVPATVAGPDKPAAAKPAAKPDTEVDVKGEKVRFPDAKTAKLAQLLGAANPNNPVALSDAAAQAGLTPPVPGQDPGSQIAPVDAKPGDVLVAGEKSFMVLGDGKFYDLSAYQVVDADMLPKDLGDRAGYFRLGDPGDGGPGGPVSGPTRGRCRSMCLAVRRWR